MSKRHIKLGENGSERVQKERSVKSYSDPISVIYTQIDLKLYIKPALFFFNSIFTDPQNKT